MSNLLIIDSDNIFIIIKKFLANRNKKLSNSIRNIDNKYHRKVVVKKNKNYNYFQLINTENLDCSFK